VRRVSLGLGRLGSYAGDGSGDIFIAFSTAKTSSIAGSAAQQVRMQPNDQLDPIFLATVQAVEEAVVNAMIAAKDMSGVDNHFVRAIPHDALKSVLRKYNRLETKK
jgi:L-aminopeptidase/D-esterase-like protein